MPKNTGSTRRRLARTLLLPSLVLILLPIASAELPSAALGQVQEDTDRWIELQTQIARTQAEWKSEKALLDSTIKLLEAEEGTLKSSIDANEKASEVYLGNRDRIRRGIEEQRVALASLRDPLDRIESELSVLLPRLPEPLLQELQIHLNKIEGDEDSEIAIPVRVQSLVAALSAIDRFGNSLTAARITRPGPDSGEVSVRVLYWGLACGYGIDEANQRAWVIQPGGDGWDWQQRDELFGAISEMFANYEKDSTDPKLISLPAALR